MARPRTFDEDQVLEGAVELFREQGYEGTSVPELSRRLGICRQSLYSAFGDKRALYLKALERYGEREIDTKIAVLEADGSPIENVRTLVRSLAAYATNCPSDGCLTVTALVEGRGDEDATAVVARHVTRLENGYRRTLERARDAGELKPDVKTDRLARALVTATHGIGLLTRLPKSGPRIADTVATLLGLIDDAAAES